jgi:hypothetical protein
MVCKIPADRATGEAGSDEILIENLLGPIDPNARAQHIL